MSSPYGALKTLMTMLAAAPSLTQVNASVLFGEENITAQDKPTPMVVVVPIGGQWNGPTDSPGYYRHASLDIRNVWMTQEEIKLYLWSAYQGPGATAIDHADAVEDLRARVLQALWNQQPKGLKFVPQSGQWQLASNEVNRYGRGYMLSVQVDIAVPDVAPVEMTVTSVTVTPTIQEG